jgi:E3 ubiquitin-protein ligase RFWD2
MADSSVAAGALVPSVPKPDPAQSGGDAAAAQHQALAEDASPSPSPSPEEGDGAGVGEPAAAVDRELLCPICMALIKDAFLTACGHSFCYMCIVTHLTHKSDCPCCSNYLTKAQLYPNFLLDKVRSFASFIPSPSINLWGRCRTEAFGTRLVAAML